jgi:hypothetical protein
MMTEVEDLRGKIRQLYSKRELGDLTEKAFQRELVGGTLDLYRTLLKNRLYKEETILKEHHVVQAHFRVTQSVLGEPDQETISLFATDRRLFCIRSVLKPNRPPTADTQDQTVIEEIAFKKIESLKLRHQIRWGEVGVGAAMGGMALLFGPWLSFTGPFLIGLGAAGILHALMMPTRWIEIIPRESDPSQSPILIQALRKRSARNLVRFLKLRKEIG